jgi:hypothetical protein
MSTVPELVKVVMEEEAARFTSPEPVSVVIVAAPVRLVIPVAELVSVVIVEVPVTLVVPEVSIVVAVTLPVKEICPPDEMVAPLLMITLLAIVCNGPAETVRLATVKSFPLSENCAVPSNVSAVKLNDEISLLRVGLADAFSPVSRMLSPAVGTPIVPTFPVPVESVQFPAELKKLSAPHQ